MFVLLQTYYNKFKPEPNRGRHEAKQPESQQRKSLLHAYIEYNNDYGHFN